MTIQTVLFDLLLPIAAGVAASAVAGTVYETIKSFLRRSLSLKLNIDDKMIISIAKGIKDEDIQRIIQVLGNKHD